MPAPPDFRLYHGNDLELLAGLLAAELAKPLPVAGATLLVPDTILVPQPAVRRWLQKVLAERHGIAANLRFLAPGQFVKLALDANVEGADDAAVGEAAVLRWRLWELLADPALRREPVFAPLAALLAREDDPRAAAAPGILPPAALAHPCAAWSLAGELAAAFEKYQAWRRDWLLRWDRGGDKADWQAELWRRATRGLAHRGRRLDAYLARFSADSDAIPAGLPARLFAFACQNVSPDVLRVIASAARAGPLHFHFLSPVAGWWGDLRTARERLADPDAQGRASAAAGRMPEAADGFVMDDENPLLRANGAAGRDFVRLLFGYEVAHPSFEHAAYVPPDPATRTGVLHELQRDLLARRPAPARGSREFAAIDSSLQVHACPTRLREVQVLHDQLRALLEADPTLQPRDIAVLAADIDAYAPFVPAVFGDGGGRAHEAIPYALADGRVLARRPVAAAFARLLELPTARFGVNEVLDLFAVPAVAEHAGLAATDLDALREALAAAGVRWGLNDAHRAELGEPAESAYSWAWGLDRLLLGHASGDDADLAGVAPLPRLDGGGLALLDRLLPLLRRLAHWQRALATPRTPAAWGVALAKLLDEVFPERASDPVERQAIDDLRATVAHLADEAAQAGIVRAVPSEVVRAWFAATLADEDTRAPLLTGGVSFGRMVPMRLVPFKVICLLGMNDGEFPRRDPPGGLNRLAAALGGPERRPGDRSVRDDDRGLFLQLFAAAGQAFYVSYLGQDPRTGETLPPSVVVSELVDAAAGYTTDPAAARAGFVVEHPLQPFSPAAVGAAGAMPADARRFTYRRDWAAGAAAAADAAQRAPPAPFAAALPAAADAPVTAWSRDELVRALSRPAREFLQARLGVRVPDADARLPEEEPFDTNDGLARWQLDDRLLELALDGANAASGKLPESETLVARLLAEGRIAPGAAGVAAVRAAQGRLAPVLWAWRGRDGGPARERAWSLALDDVRLSGVHRRVHDDGLRQFSASRAHGKTVLALGVDALAWWAAGETAPVARATLGAAPHALTPVPPDEARVRLRRLLEIAVRARREPLPFAPRAALAWVVHGENGARGAAAEWRGDFGEGADAWVQLALRGAMPFAHDASTQAFAALAAQVFALLPDVPVAMAAAEAVDD